MNNFLKRFKRFVPSREKLKNNPRLAIFGKRLFMPSLWNPNRHTVKRAAAIGLFWTMPPIPLQMLIVAFFCIRFKANIPLSFALVWITNPVTLAPITLMQYKIGVLLLGRGEENMGLLEQIMANDSFFSRVGAVASEVATLVLPVVIGSVFIGVVLAIIGYLSVGILWEVRTWRRWRARARKRSALSREP